MLAVTNGTVVTVTSGTIDNGTVLVEDGKIMAVGAGLDIPEGAEVIVAKGGVIMPGLSPIHISEPTTPADTSYAVFCFTQNIA